MTGPSTIAGPPLTGAAARTGGLGRFAFDLASSYGNAPALVFDDPLAHDRTTRWTYRDLATQARSIARGLVADGVTVGEPVAVAMGNRPESLAAALALAAIGALPVLVSTFAPPPELAAMFTATGVTTVLTQTRLLRRRPAEEATGLIGAVPTLHTVHAIGDDWDDWLARAHRGELDAEVDARATTTRSDTGAGADSWSERTGNDALVLFSSGTSSTPKGIVHGSGGPVIAAFLQADVFARGPSTRMWSPLPMFWSAGFMSATTATLAAGGTCILQETFEPGAALELMDRERITEPYLLPHQARALTDDPAWGHTDLSSLRQVFGKSVFSRHPGVQGDPAWNMPVGYGMTETCALFAAHRADAGREAMRRSHGPLLAGNELRVVDPERNTVLDIGIEGELCVRGPSLMRRYVGKAAADCFDTDGFLHTGDVGFRDERGEVHFTGRATSMIKTDGANVSPAEIEVALRGCPEVRLARVVGIPDVDHDEIVVACVTPADGAPRDAQRIRAFLAERVASYKVPRRVLFFDDGTIPMTNAGSKVRDPELIALVEQRLAIERTGGASVP